eukprot:10378517-Alexandrium_andersonii.AAC.1
MQTSLSTAAPSPLPAAAADLEGLEESAFPLAFADFGGFGALGGGMPSDAVAAGAADGSWA